MKPVIQLARKPDGVPVVMLVDGPEGPPVTADELTIGVPHEEFGLGYIGQALLERARKEGIL